MDPGPKVAACVVLVDISREFVVVSREKKLVLLCTFRNSGGKWVPAGKGERPVMVKAEQSRPSNRERRVEKERESTITWVYVWPTDPHPHSFFPFSLFFLVVLCLKLPFPSEQARHACLGKTVIIKCRRMVMGLSLARMCGCVCGCTY